MGGRLNSPPKKGEIQMKNILKKLADIIKTNAVLISVIVIVIALIAGAALTVDIWGDWVVLIVGATLYVAYKIYTNQPQTADSNASRIQFQNQIYDNLIRTFARALRAYEDSNKTAKIPTLKDVSNVLFTWNDNVPFAVFAIQKRFLTNNDKISQDFISQINSVLESYANEIPAQIVHTIYGSFVPFYQVYDIKDDLNFVRIAVRIGWVVGNSSVSPEVYNADF